MDEDTSQERQIPAVFRFKNFSSVSPLSQLYYLCILVTVPFLGYNLT